MRKVLSAGFGICLLLSGCVGDDVASEGSESPGGLSFKPMRVSMFKIDGKGVGVEIGALLISDSRGGLRIEAALGSLPPGEHGFHLHEGGSCAAGEKDGKLQAGLAAGSHYDPHGLKVHAGPFGDGHRGDLPFLVVDEQGNATGTVHALRLSVNDARGKTFVIHRGGDNFADAPKPLGGGGERIACGVVPSGT